jgi:hypothetical protein
MFFISFIVNILFIARRYRNKPILSSFSILTAGGASRAGGVGHVGRGGLRLLFSV